LAGRYTITALAELVPPRLEKPRSPAGPPGTIPIVRRRLLKFLTLLSLLLCVAASALWVRAHFVSDVIGVSRREDGQVVSRCLFTGYSVVGYAWSATIVPTGREGFFHRRTGPRWPPRPRLVPTLQEYVELHSPPGTPPDWVEYTVPLWMCVVAFAAAPAVRLRRMARARRLARVGHCARCGYDLRATPGRCPECGRETPTPAR
jgi:hypothetical protein